jgi:hypothetical protein
MANFGTTTLAIAIGRQSGDSDRKAPRLGTIGQDGTLNRPLSRYSISPAGTIAVVVMIVPAPGTAMAMMAAEMGPDADAADVDPEADAGIRRRRTYQGQCKNRSCELFHGSVLSWDCDDFIYSRYGDDEFLVNV